MIADKRKAVLKDGEAGGSQAKRIVPTVKDLQKQKAEGSVPSAASRYYKRPELGSEYGKLEADLKEKRQTLSTAEKQLKLKQLRTADLREAADAFTQHARIMEQRYGKTSGAASSRQRADELWLQWAGSVDESEAAERKYQDAVSGYNGSAMAWKTYADSQEEEFKRWRGSIRESSQVQQEIAQVEELIRQQEALDNPSRQELAGTPYAARQGAGLPGQPYGAALSQPDSLTVTESEAMKALKERLELLREEDYYSNYYRWEDFRGAEDFAEKSRYVTTATPEGRNRWREAITGITGMPGESGFADPMYDYINRNQDAGLYLQELAGGDPATMENLFGKLYSSQANSRSEAETMTDDEVLLYNYLYATQGKEKANEYYSWLRTYLNQRQREQETGQLQQIARESPVIASGLSVLAAPAKGLAFLGQTADLIRDGKIDENAAYNRLSYGPSAIREEVDKQIRESGKWGAAGSFAYQTAMSMGDFLMNAAVGGRNLSMAVMGSGAAADTTIAAKDRGLSDGKAYTMGIVAGLAEAVTEKVSLEALLNPDMLKDGALRYILKNMFAEGSEEVASDIINLTADVILNADKSELRQAVETYMAQGKTENEAYGLAMGDQAAQMGLDFLGGFISGGAVSGVNAAFQNGHTGKIAKSIGEMKLDPADVPAFIEQGLESGEDTAAYAIALEVKEKLERGQEITEWDLARMWQANAQAIEAEAIDAEETDGEVLPTPTHVGTPSPQGEGLSDPLINAGDGAAEQTGPMTEQAVHQVRQEAELPATFQEEVNRQFQENHRLDMGESSPTPAPVGAPAPQGEDLGATAINAGGKNGGYEYGSQEKQTAGNRVSDGGQGWNAGTGAGKQTGSMAAGTGSSGRRAAADRSRAAAARQNLAKSLRLEKISSLELGLQSGTEARSIQVMPQEHWDGEMQELAQRIYNETGKNVTYVLGRIPVRGAGGKVSYARGAISGDNIIVQADNFGISMEQIADHEAYHAKAEFAGGLNREIRQHIIETFSREELQAVLDKYIVALRGVIDVGSDSGPEAFQAAVQAAQEELFADAYAGINAFGAGADRFTEAVNEKMNELYMGRQTRQENGTQEPTGPPRERFSISENIVGENAEKSNSEHTATGKNQRSRYQEPKAGRTQSVASEASDGAVPSTDNGRGSHINRSSGETIADRPGNVKQDVADTLSEEIERQWREKYSLDEETEVDSRGGELNPEPTGPPRERFSFEQGPILNKEIEDNIDTIARMDPVAQLNGDEFEYGGNTLTDDVDAFFNSIGGAVTNERIGSVILNRRSVKDDRSHGMSSEKAASFAAVPDVIKNGKIVGYEENWKNRGYETVTIAAPIVIGPDNYMMGVVIRRSNDRNRFYVHDVFTEKEATPFNRGHQNGLPGGATSTVSIINRIFDVKRKIGNGKQDVADTLSEEIERQWREKYSLGEYADSSDYEGKSLTESPEIYTYDFLTAQPDMQAVMLPDLDGIRDNSGRIDTARVLAEGMKNARSVGTERDGKVFVENRYTGRELYITGKSLRHSVNGDRNRLFTNARIGCMAGDLIHNAIPINALHNTATDASGTYAMAGYAIGADGREFAVIITVEQRSETISGINAYDVAHSISGRIKKGNSQAATNAQGFYPIKTVPEISIADLIDVVNSTYQSVLSENVLNALGETRNPEGHYSDRVRYSIDDGEREAVETDYAALDAQLKKERERWDEAWLRDQAGEEGVSGYREWLKSQEARKKQDAAARAKVQRDMKRNQAKLKKEFRDSAADQKAKKRMADAQKPTIAKRELRRTVLDLFSVPTGSRGEIGEMINTFADRLMKNGTITEDDRRRFFDRLYESGVMTVPAEDYLAEGRAYIKGGTIYVSDMIVNELGDDWEPLRRRAFAAGVMLTRDAARASTTGGIDVWNGELAQNLPWLFDSEDTDLRIILEKIVQVAEEGKDQKMSLPEYTRLLAGQEQQSEQEFLDNMERQLDWALRTFAEKAQLEVKLKTRAEQAAAGKEKENIRLKMEKAQEREARMEAARMQQERKELREMQQKTLKTLQWLSKNRNRAPEDLRDAWNEVLGDIDIYAVSAANEMQWSDRYNATWKDLAQMYKDAQKNDPNFLPSKDLEMIVDRLDGTKIADMDIGALQDLYKAAVGLRTEFYNRKNVMGDEMHRLFEEVYADAKTEIQNAPGGFTGKKLDKLTNLQQLTPMNVLERMGGWDPNGTFYSMAKQLERGERDIRAYKVKAERILAQFLEENQEWVKKADGQGKDAIWYEVEFPELVQLGMGDKPIFGGTVKVSMTPAQKVHMYLESKNYDNLRHMTGGRTFVNKKLYSEGKRQEALAQGITVRMAPETVKKIVSDLTPEEMELAKLLDQYYNTFATGEINRVSNILYGYDKAMGKNYAPIYTNKNYNQTEFGVFDVTAEGVGNLKGRQVAKNPSYNISAIEAFEKHIDQTARFVGMAIPARNWTSLMNWRETNNSMGDVITHKWGKEMKDYISDLITKLQSGGSAESDVVSDTINKAMSNYITAIFGANPSIVLKQLGSIPMAAAYLDARNFPKANQIRSIDTELIGKYTQDLQWRTMGYSMPETKQLKDNPNWTQTNKAFQFAFGGGAITAMDGWAASTLWPWAENKVRRDFPDLEMGTQEQIRDGQSPFYKKVAELFEEAVSRSQSVSDEIHQSSLRKSKNPITRAFTLFKSDSAQTYNVIRQKIGEAKFLIRSGAGKSDIRAAQKAAGTAFCAMLLNAAWAEAVTFLMALWKHKDKRYRDDEGELTAESVIEEMVNGMRGSVAGTFVVGEEIFELVGKIITGERWYGLETPGMEQLNDAIEAVIDAGGSMKKLMAGAVDILKNGGDLAQYFGNHSGEILGSIKDIALEAATYLTGLPVSNVEAYLMGAFRWIPGVGEAYDDLFQDAGKQDLKELEGDALQQRLGDILQERRITENADAVAVLAELYEQGHKSAVPSDIPSSVTINGETRKLGEYDQQFYGNVWSSIVADGLEDLISSEMFAGADDATREKMLKNLYIYAADKTKAELFDDYELPSGTRKNEEIIAAGASAADVIAWNTVTSEMKSAQKAELLAEMDLPEQAKRAIFRNKVTDSREDTVEAFRDAGIGFDQFLRAYSEYSTVNAMDVKAGRKAAEFAHWVNDQGFSAEQENVIKDSLKFYNMNPASAEKYDELVDAGMDDEEVLDLIDSLAEIEPEDGQTTVSDLQKWRGCIEFSDDVERQLIALAMAMQDSTMAKVDMAYEFGVMPESYVSLQEIKFEYDADGNGSLTQAETKAAIDALPGLTKAQRAVLWQLSNSDWKAGKNPYDPRVGQQVVDARNAAKEG